MAGVIAVTSALLLTGAVRTQRLEITRSANATYDDSYDLLVRSAGSVSGLEAGTDLVRPNFLTSQYGGISLQQWRTVQGLSGVQVAAPLAILGVVWGLVPITLDLTPYTAGWGRTLLRVSSSGASRSGAERAGQSAYLYTTPNRLTAVSDATRQIAESADGATVYPCLGSQNSGPDVGSDSPFAASARYTSFCYSRQQAGTRSVTVNVGVPLVVAAVDPASEARLEGLGQAVTQGRYLSSSDAAQVVSARSLGFSRNSPMPVTPALLATSYQDVAYAVRTVVDRLPESTVARLLAARYRTDQMDAVADSSSAGTVLERDDSMTTVYSQLVHTYFPSSGRSEKNTTIVAFSVLRPSAANLTMTGTGLTATGKTPNLSVYEGNGYPSSWDPVPTSVADPAYRNLTVLRTDKTTSFGGLGFHVVGTYDPAKTVSGRSDNDAALGIYATSAITAADASTRAALGADVMMSNLDPADYVQLRPSLLVPLSALPIVGDKYLTSTSDPYNPSTTTPDSTAPLSAIRVKVAGVTGVDAASRERIRAVAQEITRATGLRVDVTAGSSPTAQTIRLTQPGQDLAVIEEWTRKGVAVQIVQAVDRKSLLLTLLILVSSMVTIAMVTQAMADAQARTRRILSAVGHRPATIASTLLGGQATLGLIAGIIGAGLAWPIGRLTHVAVSPWALTAAVPAGVLMTILAALPATLAIGREGPEGRRPRPPRSPRATTGAPRAGAIGVRFLLRHRLRWILASVAVALAVCVMTTSLTLLTAFHGDVVGTVLGNVVAIQVRQTDLIAACVIAVLAIVSVTTAVSLGGLEDEGAWAVLWASGWSSRLMRRAMLAQSLAISLVGIAAGILAAAGLVGLLVGRFPPATLWVAAASAAGAVLLCGVASLIPFEWLLRRPLAETLQGRQ